MKKSASVVKNRIRRPRSTNCEICDVLPWNDGAKRRCIHHGFSVDIGCGPHRQPGFIGTDRRAIPGVDLVFDLEEYPWPLPSDAADQVLMSHLIEHIDPKFQFDFMNEVWRVIKEGGQLLLVTPHASSFGWQQDPTHQAKWNEATPAYFCPEHPSNLWSIYKPKPWRLIRMNFSPIGNIECTFFPLKSKKLLRKFEVNGKP